jgi:hypothetical protein
MELKFQKLNKIKNVAPTAFGWMLAAFGVLDLIALLSCFVLLVYVVFYTH